MLSDRRYPCFRNAVETSRSTSQSDSIVRQTNKRSFLSYTTMNNIHIFNDIENICCSLILSSGLNFFVPLPPPKEILPGMAPFFQREILSDFLFNLINPENVC